MSKIKETKVYNINDFINWNNNGELEISPKYQRNSVWNIKAKSYLIDTIIRGLPVPQIFMRQMVDIRTRRTRREIIDGQQRLRTILEFVNDEFQILKSHNIEYAGRRFSDLPEEIQEEFLDYELPVEVIKTKNDSVVYDMFARVNTNNMALNNQELRNAKYWGEFKVFIYNTAARYRGFFIDINMFNDKQLSRMGDTEYISSLVIGIIDGVVNETPKKIDSYYAKYDEEFNLIDEVDYKFNKILKIIEKILCFSNLTTSYFHRKVYFYTLFMALNHMLFGVDNIEIKRSSEYYDENIDDNINKLSRNLSEFESKYDRFLNETLYDQEEVNKLIKFEKNHRSRTTSFSERLERVSILLDYLED
ncbi:DUF262 domain-containing protein [Clostridium perfringens]|uniref:DUF262 domain-containing protein n=1 Tax=Clostridium perfringens TaxID=1502 RepID=UPI0013E2999C|nr:DUF262 domain-containing protein [Clostridium perfringens]NGU67432.1 DUF262 domain-containing protein [Clostridium perfringens]